MSRKRKKNNGGEAQASLKNEKAPQRDGALRATLTHKGKITVAIACGVLAAAILFGIVFGIVLAVRSGAPFDYISEDLTRYVEVPKDIYRDFEAEVDVRAVSDYDVNLQIFQALASKRGKTLYDGELRYDKVFNPGDEAKVYLRGYELDEDGREIDLSGTCNFYDDEAASTNELMTGIAMGLWGKNPSDYSRFYKLDSKELIGEILDGDVVYLTITYSYETALPEMDKRVRIDLADPELEATWGVGIGDFIKGLKVGEAKEDDLTLTLAGSDEKVTILSARLDFVTRCEDNPIVIEAIFPADYKEESYRNKTVIWEAYVFGAYHYESAELTEDFVLKTIGIEEDTLGEYEGEGVVEKYKNMIRARLVDAYESDVDFAVEEALLEYLMRKVSFRWLPEGEINRLYEKRYNELLLEYYSASDQFTGSFELFLVNGFELEDDEDPFEYLKKFYENQVKEQLVFYSVIKNEGYIPDEEEHKKLYRELLLADFDYENTEEFKTDEEYEAAVSAFEEEMLVAYGENYYSEAVYYNFGREKLLKNIKVNNKGA